MSPKDTISNSSSETSADLIPAATDGSHFTAGISFPVPAVASGRPTNDEVEGSTDGLFGGGLRTQRVFRGASQQGLVASDCDIVDGRTLLEDFFVFPGRQIRLRLLPAGLLMQWRREPQLCPFQCRGSRACPPPE